MSSALFGQLIQSREAFISLPHDKLPNCFGPVLYFRGRSDSKLTTGSTSMWSVSAMLMVPTLLHDPPVLSVTSSEPKFIVPAALRCAETLGGYSRWKFLRYDMSYPMHEKVEVTVFIKGEVANDGAAPYRVSASFRIPSLKMEPKMMVFSCNGLQNPPADYKKLSNPYFPAMWKHFGDTCLNKNDGSGVHVIFGLGDQIYGDPVLNGPLVKEWNKLPRAQRFAAPYTVEQQAEVEDMYLRLYLAYYSQPEVYTALSSCPIVAIADDHDFFDGKGSHETEYNNCPMYKGIAASGHKFRMFFQLALAVDSDGKSRSAVPPPFFGERSYSFISMLSPSVAVVALDHRSEREVNSREPEKSILMTRASWEMVSNAINRIVPSTCQHLIVMLFGPLVCRVNKALQHVAELLVKAANTELLESLFSGHFFWNDPQHRPDMVDDMRDNYDSIFNAKSRETFLKFFEYFARNRKLRITYVGGDIHAGGAGEIRRSVGGASPLSDTSYSVQFITSPIANYPCVELILKSLSEFNDKFAEIGPQLEGRLCTDWLDGNGLMSARNYLVISVGPGQVTDTGIAKGCKGLTLTGKLCYEQGTTVKSEQRQIPCIQHEEGGCCGC